MEGSISSGVIPPDPPIDALVARVRSAAACAREGLVERDDALYLAIVAMVAGEHVLLVGPPGTAKSEVARRLSWLLRDARWFERLLTRFTVPEEVFGPLSIKGLQNDVYERLGDGYLPTADVVFLDEVFRANSAILNALLGVLNERAVDVGARRVAIPLACVVAACNAIPEDEDLGALSDRFVVRHELTPVSEDAFASMLRAGAARAPGDDARLSPSDLRRLRAATEEVTLPPWVVDLARATRRGLEGRAIYASDRRWKKAMRVVRAAALLAGRREVTIPDVTLLSACLWQKPSERPVVESLLRHELDEILDHEPRRYESIALTIEKVANGDEKDTQQAADDGGPLFVDPEGYATNAPSTRVRKRNATGDLLFRAPPNGSGRHVWTLEELRSEIFPTICELRAWVSDPSTWIVEETPHEPLVARASLPHDYVAERTGQIDALLCSLHAFRGALADARGDATFGPPTFALAAAETAEARLAAVAETLRKARDAYASMPVDAAPVRVAS